MLNCNAYYRGDLGDDSSGVIFYRGMILLKEEESVLFYHDNHAIVESSDELF